MIRKCGVLIGLACLPIVDISSSSSSFAQEAYYKIEIQKEGLYKIDQAWLNQFGIRLDGLDPRTIRIFNNGGRELPQNIDAPRPADLIENAVFVSGEDDGRFDPEDFILFYARSVHGYDFDPLRKTYQYHLHHYTDQNVYWLVWGGGARGKRMRLIDGAPIQPNAIPRTGFRERLHLEQEKLNSFRAGLTWYWERVSYGESKYFRFELREPVMNDSSALTIRLEGYPPSFADFQLFLNNFFLGQFSLTVSQPQTLRVSSLGALRNGENVVEVRSLSLAGHID